MRTFVLSRLVSSSPLMEPEMRTSVTTTSGRSVTAIWQATMEFSAVIGAFASVHVVVAAPYGFTVTAASASVEGRWRDVTVTHCPGFTSLMAAKLPSGTFTRIVRY